MNKQNESLKWLNENKGIYKVFILKDIDSFNDKTKVIKVSNTLDTPFDEVNDFLSKLNTTNKNSSLYLQFGHITQQDLDNNIMDVNMICCRFADHKNSNLKNPKYDELIKFIKTKFPNFACKPLPRPVLDFNVSSISTNTDRSWGIDLNAKALDIKNAKLKLDGAKIIKISWVDSNLFENLNENKTWVIKSNVMAFVIMYIENK